jgi:hypothetical protein
VVFSGHLPYRDHVQAPETKSRSNACSLKICYACGGRSEGKHLNEMGRIWSLSHFHHTLCWRDGGIVRLWQSVDILVVMTAIAP